MTNRNNCLETFTLLGFKHCKGAGFIMLTPLLLRCMMKAPQAGWVIAARLRAGSRKVRTPQGTAPGKPRDGAICRIGPQKEVAA